MVNALTDKDIRHERDALKPRGGRGHYGGNRVGRDIAMHRAFASHCDDLTVDVDMSLERISQANQIRRKR